MLSESTEDVLRRAFQIEANRRCRAEEQLRIARAALEYLADDTHLVPFPRTLARDVLSQIAALEPAPE